MSGQAHASERVPSSDALRPFVELAERRLYRALVTEAERQLARCERGDALILREALRSTAELFLLARNFTTPTSISSTPEER